MTPDDPNVTRPAGAPPADPNTTVDAPQTGTVVRGPDHTTVPAASETETTATATVAGYEIERELGRGGMGVVYLATQRGLNRRVALKTLIGSDAARPVLARFWAEAQVMAEVRHPNVVQVIELGESDGRPFMAMEFVPGGSLSGRLKGGKQLPPTEAAALLERVARGVAAAHDLGVVHRDLKPDNVLMDGDTPKVADFGIAKRKAQDLTQTSAMMGTPAYMSPEQAAAQSKFVGPPADVWALGVMLYEMLTGRRPFVGDTVMAILGRIADTEPAPLRTLTTGTPRDLQTIVSKCLSKEPELRYPTATELADDLGRFVRGEPIAARPLGPAERVARWVRRKPTAAAAWGFSTLAVALAVVSGVVFGFWREAAGANVRLEGEKRLTEDARGEAERLRGVAEAARHEEARLRGVADRNRDDALTQKGAAEQARAAADEARGAVERERAKLAALEYGAAVRVAHQEWRDSDVVAMRAILGDTNPERRGWEWGYLNRIADSSLLTLKEHTESVLAAAFSPDGSRVATSGNDKTVRVWDADTGKRLLTIKDTGAVRAAAFSPDGTRLLTTTDRVAKVWDANTGANLLALKGVALYAAWSPDGARVITSDAFSSDKTAHVWDARTGAELLVLKGHTGGVSTAAWSADGERIVTASGDKTVRIWDAQTGAERLSLPAFLNAATAASFSPDGTRVLTVTDAAAQVWDAKTGAELLALRGHARKISVAAFSPNGNLILTAGYDGTVKVWTSKSGLDVATLRGHASAIYSAAWSPNGARIVTAGFDKTARIWDARRGAEHFTFGFHSGLIHCAAWSRDGARVAFGSSDGAVRVWDARTGAAGPILRGQPGWVNAVAWNPDGTRVASGGAAGVILFDAQSGRGLRVLRMAKGDVRGMAWSRDGTRIVATGASGGVWVWDANTGAEGPAFKGHASLLATAAVFSPDGTRIATAGTDATRIWNAATGAELLVLDRAVAVAFSPDGARIVTAVGSAMKVWDSRTGAELLALKGHTDAVHAVAFSPDGTRIVSTSDDQTARVWDANTGVEVLTLKGHTRGALAAAWNPDGVRLLTTNGNAVQVWDSRPFRDTRPPDPPSLAPPPRPVVR